MEKGRKDCDSPKTMHNGIFYVYREVAPVKSQQHWLPKQDLKIDISGHANENGGKLHKYLLLHEDLQAVSGCWEGEV